MHDAQGEAFVYMLVMSLFIGLMDPTETVLSAGPRNYCILWSECRYFTVHKHTIWCTCTLKPPYKWGWKANPKGGHIPSRHSMAYF